MDFDETRLYYSHQQLQRRQDEPEENDDPFDDDEVDLDAVQRHFREFLRNYRLGTQRYIYREKLLRMHRRLANADAPEAEESQGRKGNSHISNNAAVLEVDVSHLGEYDGSLLGYLRDQPATILPVIELAASDALQSLLYEMKTNVDELDQEPDQLDGQAPDNTVQQKPDRMMIQILLKGNLTHTPLRGIKSEHMNRLIKCPGIVISAQPVRCRAIKLVVRCPRCLHTEQVYATDGPFGTVQLPSRCSGPQPQECGANPYAVVPDDSQFCDRQTLKVQEAPEKVPTGEMPRSVLVAVERSLVDKAPPGTRVSLFCIPTLFTNSASGGTRSVYLRVVGLTKDHQSGESVQFTPAEEEAFSQLARHPDVYEIMCRSVAPSIQGSYTVDIKKSLVCMLMGGTRKKLPDGLRLRGDINILLMGDPSTAKSQFLKFVSKTAPIGIYTSGKGSSAAGLTASVVKDSRGEFYLEGGAMVLADGGIVCIDEFDKMRPADRVAIHEAMEQQTISVAKAGITTVLNSRSAVLAAANPVYGRYDDYKSASEQIDLMTTILSRFDLIFLVRDVREEERDRMICKHVMGVHINNSQSNGGEDGTAAFLSSVNAMTEEQGDWARSEALANSPEAIADNVMRIVTTGKGELDVPSMKKYIQYCKTKCKPTLSEEAGQVLTSSYVKIRDGVRKNNMQSSGGEDTQSVIPITVRQLEALVRISESLAKIRLDSEVRIEDVNEALRLFRVSTMAANSVDQNMMSQSILAGGSNPEEVERAQSFLRSRLAVGSLVNKQRLLEEAAGQGYNVMVLSKVVSVMAMQGEILERNQGRLIKRIK
eukprot:Nitzschia sp. Nitz4//scaffold41_size133979//5474//8075//NITZ4_003325-RA/size133979-processed-gene-0.235-mRNA-1//-1//CDS//3329551404//4663//frame0